MTFGMKPFFQIPVYAEPWDDYHAWLETKIAPYRRAAVKRGESPERSEAVARTIWGTSWQYNRVVGWIELHAARDVIKAYVTWTEQQRIRKDRKDAFRFAREWKIFECWLHDGMSSVDVFDALSAALNDAATEAPLEGRWVDRTAFDALGPHVDFAGFLGLSSATERSW